MKKKLLLLTVILVSATIAVKSQVTEAEAKLKTQTKDTLEGWKLGGVIGATVAQTSLTNWAAGGQSSFAVNGVFSTFANYKKGKNAWDNSLDLGYGILNQEDVKYTKKTDDKIDILSKYGREVRKSLYFAGLLNFKTQMTTGYNYPTDSTRTKISNLLAPAYLVGALGLDYKPNSHLSVFAAPATAKFTFVNDTMLSNAGAFGIDKGDKVKSEFGGYIRFIYSKNDFTSEMLKNVSFTTKLDLFSNYAEDPQNIVVNWETLIAFKVNKYININISTHLIYDDKVKIGKDSNNNGVIEENEIKPRVQFKELFGAGVSFKF
ncbi:MAG: DUF3078 domain-containing protein [Bacteroidales bacterium]|nr:DUF3078 domain-containing protein [Bacteroidales bacterium]